jgi:hypothetical protein
VLFILFDIVFGIFVAYQVYGFREHTCSANKKGIGEGIIGTAITLFVGACPSCFGLAALLLPISIVGVFSILGPLFVVLGLALMVLSIHMNNGFR